MHWVVQQHMSASHGWYWIGTLTLISCCQWECYVLSFYFVYLTRNILVALWGLNESHLGPILRKSDCFLSNLYKYPEVYDFFFNLHNLQEADVKPVSRLLTEGICRFLLLIHSRYKHKVSLLKWTCHTFNSFFSTFNLFSCGLYKVELQFLNFWISGYFSSNQ